ncbi:serine carboxypeptidase [Nitzschia inconspicua]|uniref:Carboxypeptidase n=1 Tax=Nitzschia inconspicua TaxID=303405 RepID=A0A9K3K7L4_9STRA|nr:serine carboxypeptidase [Nitzschia inconspicua]KAG7348282.1 serine carboxypeptidase [Nitzschia inconspicua]
MTRGVSNLFGRLLVVLSMLQGTTASKNEGDDVYQLPTAADFRVKDLDQVVSAFSKFPGRMYAGSLPMDHKSFTPGANPNQERTGYLQFWLFVPDKIAAKDTMVAWFNGGPGCSSFSAGVMFEHSPVTVPLNPAGWCCEESDAPLGYNTYAWTNATVMLYVEQPIGVGFSEATNDTPQPFSEDDVAADFDAFLQNFYKVFDGHESPTDDYDRKLDMRVHNLNLVGESYAGTYIPSVARGIYLNNLKNEDNIDGSPRFQTPLTGIAIGNGKIDAITQDPAIIDYAYWHGLIDLGTKEYLYAEWDHCIANMKAGKMGPGTEPKPFHSFTIRDDCGVFEGMLTAAGAGAFEKMMGGPNIYEYSTWDEYAAADGDGGTVSMFYNNIKVQEALNVPKHQRGPHHKWEGCIPETAPSGRRLASADVSAVTGESSFLDAMNRQRRKLFMDYDTPWSVTPYIAELLDEAKIDVLIYSGDRDIICCTQGSEEALRKMDWSGARELAPSDGVATSKRNAWTEAPRGLWLYNDYPAGYTKAYKNLNLLTIYNAGHMVPYNQPGPALDMLTRFLKGEDFYDRPLVTFSSYPMPDKVLPVGTPPKNQEPSVLNAMQMSATSGMPHLHSADVFSTQAFGSVVAIAAVAFVLGILVARRTMVGENQVVPSNRESSEGRSLTEGQTYGSL